MLLLPLTSLTFKFCGSLLNQQNRALPFRHTAESSHELPVPCSSNKLAQVKDIWDSQLKEKADSCSSFLYVASALT